MKIKQVMTEGVSDVVLRVVAAGTELNTCTARDAISPGSLYCFDDQNVADILKDMGERQIRRLPVIGNGNPS